MNIKNILFIIAAFLIPVNAYTLGFGPIHVYSKLNEPLKLEFQLIDSKGINPDDIIIANASIETYQKADLFRPADFNKAKFTPVKKSDGSIVIKVSSKKPFRELYVTFIADLMWKNVHLNREYTFFLDPANFAPQKKNNAKVVSQKKKTSVSTSRKSTRTYPRKSLIPGDTYIVQRADTLSQISRRARPDDSVSAYQTMNAIFALNPKAFINNNIDLLKQGYTLSLPDKEEILQLNNQPAKAKMTPAEKHSPSIAKPAMIEKEESSASEAAIVDSPEEQSAAPSGTPRLKIVPPSEDLLNRPVDDDVLELMTKTLKTSHETITLLKKENLLLSERIEKLTQKLSSFDDRNKELSNKIDHISNLIEQQKTAPVAASTAKIQAENTDKNAKAATRTPMAIEVPEITPVVNKQSMIQQIMASQDLLIIFLIAVILLFIIIYFMLKPAKKKNKPASSNNIQEDLHTDAAVSSPQKSDHVTDSAISDYFDKSSIVVEQVDSDILSDSPDIQTINDFADASEIELDLDLDKDDLDEGAPSVSSHTHEATLREVNTFMAYGKHDSAENLLLDELKKVPDDKLLHIRLFELYAETTNSTKFKHHLEIVTKLSNSDSEFLAKIDSIYLNTWKEPLRASF